MKRWISGERLPLFLRIFALMLLTLLLVQAINFLVMLLTPPPPPSMTGLDRVAAVLRGTEAPGNNLKLRAGAIAPQDAPLAGERRFRAFFAHRLGIAEDDVRMVFFMRSPFRDIPLLGRIASPPRPNPSRLVPLFGSDDQLVLVGDFAVSARLSGQWRTVSLANQSAYPWRLRSFTWLVIAMVVVAAVAWFLARALARPIDLFADAARRLGRDPKAPPLELSGPPEIREAASAFNEMQSRLNRYVEDRTTLMAAVAHDLRTPIMRLGLRLEHAPAPLRDACEGDIEDMEEMIDAVMSFVRDMSRPSRQQRLDLRSLAESVTDDFVDSGAAVHLTEGAPLIIDGDPPALKTLLNNLIGNAVKYADGAEVSLRESDAFAIIEVADRGPGMASEDLQRAFEPFFRAEPSRNRHTGGIGLGLASVRGVARAHGGEAMLDSRADGGLLASVRLPL